MRFTQAVKPPNSPNLPVNIKPLEGKLKAFTNQLVSSANKEKGDIHH